MRATRNLNREINYGAKSARLNARSGMELARRKRDESAARWDFFFRTRIYVLASNPDVPQVWSIIATY